jgi:hypothetical protein
MATFTVISLLYFTQNLVGETLPDRGTGLKFDFDPLRVGLVDDLSNHASDGGLFLGGEPLFLNSGSLQHSMVYGTVGAGWI